MQVKLNTLTPNKYQFNSIHHNCANGTVPTCAFSGENVQFMPSAYYAPLKLSSISSSFKSNVISFCGEGQNSKKVFIGAEFPPYNKIGGVATVMGDYSAFGEPMVIPYYNGHVEYDSHTGKPTGKVSVLTDRAGNPIYTNLNLDEYSMDEILAPDTHGNKKYWELERIPGKETMEWGDNPSSQIALYKVKGTNHYMVYTDQTAKMPRPYATEAGEYHSGTRAVAFKKAKAAADASTDLTKVGWQGTYSGQFGKAFTELFRLPGYENAMYVCSDCQTAFIPHYMAQKAIAGDEYWKNARASAVLHNIGEGYTGVGRAKDMFVNLGATPNDIKKVQSDPDYIKSFTVGGEDTYFKGLFPHLLDAAGDSCDLMVPLRLRQDEYLRGLITVSELYGESVAKNPEVSPGLQPILSELWDEGKFSGDLNPLHNPTLGYDKPIGLGYYANDTVAKLKDGSEITLPKFEVFGENMSIDEVMEVKRKNRLSLLSRLTGELADSEMEKVAGKSGAKAEIIGAIDKKWIEKIQNHEPVNLFCSWGRADKQKGLDSVLASFIEHVKTKEGKNSLLVIGGQMGCDKETDSKILNLLHSINSDLNMKGRVVYINGFAPGIPMASASDAAILPSRFAPCELCDLEAIKKLCVPIVTNTQGLKQKNLSPQIPEEAARATSYRTQSEFFMSLDELMNKSPEFKALYESRVDKETKKMSLRGVISDCIIDVAKENVEAAEDFKDLRAKYTDKVIEKELTECMGDFVNRPRALAEKMLENMKKLVTDGYNNGSLHPSGKSTWQLYEELMFSPVAQPPKTNLAQFLLDLRNKPVQVVTAMAETTIKTTTETAKSISKATLGWLAAGVAIVGSGIYGYNAWQKNKKAKENEYDPSLVTK